jgi:hypothetical protein
MEEYHNSMETVRQEGGEYRRVPKVVGGEKKLKKIIPWRPKGKSSCAQERR